MSHNTSQRHARQKLTVDLVAQGSWSTPQKLTLGKSGRLSRSALRAPAASTVTAVDLLVWQGSGYSTSTDPATVVGEDKVFERTGVVVAGHATTADDDYNIESNASGALFDARNDADDVWVSIKSVTAAAPMAGATWVLEAFGVE